MVKPTGPKSSISPHILADSSSSPGTYALILESQTSQVVQIGRWSAIEIQPGYYVYIGSAFGPGGVRARVARHFRLEKSDHWHIDYLRRYLSPLGVWVCHSPARLEHCWAGRLSVAEGYAPLPGFGCSDCRCHSHLFHADELENLAVLLRDGSGEIEWWPCG
ncbi:MAG: GIY-YIG nuclease family protein [Caldilineaceae bacterium]|nr:GIY-YIG nuclease family protein [Caldilineaceae bacterium]